MVLVHFKNDALKGPQHLPLSKPSLAVVTLLEQASAFYNSIVPGQVDTLFYARDGSMYKGPYFSSVGARVLSFGELKCTANDFRHLFTTAWRDFISIPTTNMLGMTATQLEEAATAMTLNSPEAWSISYDDCSMARGIHTCLTMWPKFQKFVKEQHLDKQSEEAIDPLTLSLADLGL